MTAVLLVHLYEVRTRKDRRGVDLISDVLPFGRLWYGGPKAASDAIGYASHYSRSRGAVIRVYDTAGNVIEMREHAGDFREPRSPMSRLRFWQTYPRGTTCNFLVPTTRPSHLV
jgi:hypothetical protein